MKALVILFFVMLSSGLYAQTVIVNPDGTHSVVHDLGDTKVVVNPNGTHSVILGSDTNKIMINPNGTHSQIFGVGNSKIIINPNGTHSILNTQDKFLQVLDYPNSGSQTLFVKNRGNKMIIHPNGTITQFKKKKKSIKKPSRF